MNDISQSEAGAKKTSFIKAVIIIGVVVLIAWSSIKLINVFPDKFSSLASLAESLNNNQETDLQTEDIDTFMVSSDTTLLNSGEAVKISWQKTNRTGSYTFSYVCTEGVAIDILNTDSLQSISCDSKYNVGDTGSLSLTIDSEKNRYVDVKYTIDFLATNDVRPRSSSKSSLTVINNEIDSLATETEEEVVAEVTEEKEEEAVAVAAPTIATTPAPTYQQEFTYTIPASNPNGKTDLSTRYLNIGTIVGNTFFAGAVKQDEQGAIQFEVKNYGSKTSDKWTFSVTMPNGGTYDSNNQLPLKPNERAVITVGFITTDDSRHTFEVSVDEATDRNSLNDKFEQSVKFVE